MLFLSILNFITSDIEVSKTLAISKGVQQNYDKFVEAASDFQMTPEVES